MASALATHLPLLIFMAPILLLCTFQLCSASRPLTEEPSMKQLNSESISSHELKPAVSAAPSYGVPSNPMPMSPTFRLVGEPQPPSPTFTNFTPMFPFPSMPNIPPFPFVPTLPTIPTFPSVPSVPLRTFDDSGSLVPSNGRP